MKKLFILTTILVVLLGLFYGVYIFSERENLFSTEKVIAEWKKVKSLTWGRKTDLKLTIKNNNKIDLEHVTIDFAFPGAFKVSSPKRKKIELERIRARSEKDVIIKTTPFGREGSSSTITANIEYSPQNVTSRFSKNIKLKKHIGKIPFKIKVQKEELIAPQSEINYEVTITNKSEYNIKNPEISVLNLQGLNEPQFVPQPDGFPAQWTFKEIAPQEQKVVYVRGKVAQKANLKFAILVEAKNEKGRLILSKEKEFDQVIGKNPLYLQQSIPTKNTPYLTKPNEEFSLIVKARNTTNTTLRNLSLAATFGDGLSDYTTLTPQEGGVKGNKITWETENTPQLNALPPDSEIEIPVQVKINKNIPVVTANSHSSLNVTTEIVCKDPPSTFDSKLISSVKETEVKLSSNVELHTGIEHLSGPLPVEIDEKTTFNIDLELLNTYNDIEDLGITTILPQQVSWEGSIDPDYENISYNRNKRTVSWEIDNLLAGIGYFSPIRQASFEVSITPHSKKSEYFITGEFTAKGIDQFTNKPVRVYKNALSVE